ncbi:hypothetical protein ACJZ2D_011376 [Fusarium nematophilum]
MPSLRTIVAGAALALVGITQAHHVELPSCVDPFQPYIYTGCYQDGKPGSSAPGLIYRSSQNQYNMTVEKCVAECKGNGFRYAGLKYWGVCYCGSTVNGAQLAEDQCTYPCSGNGTQICGGSDQLSIWSDPTFKTTSVIGAIGSVVNSIEAYKPLGCYTDASSKGRALSWSQDLDGATMTPSKCLGACSDQGFPLAGIEYGGECYCGNVLANDTVKVDASECSMNCNGDSSFKCGGPSRLSLFVSEDMLSLQPCGWKPAADGGRQLNAFKTCAKNVASCFQKAGWPGALDCFDFSKWCDNVQGFCASTCSRGRSCNKNSCLNQNKPQNGNSIRTTTSVFPCAATTTSATVPPASSTSVAPEPTNICQQPSSRLYGYGPGNPVAGIELPLVACNDLKGDFANKPFKLYTDDDSRSCKSYQRTQQTSACSDACKTQFDQCVNVYVQSCKKLNTKNSKRGHAHFHKRALEKSGIEPRWFNFFANDQWQTAQTKCQIQYQDCLDENRNVNAATRCSKWGTGV